MEVSAYLNETRVAFVRPEKISQISKIRHHLNLLKSSISDSYNSYSHSCFRGWHFAPFVAFTIYHVSLFKSGAHGQAHGHDNVNCDSWPYRSITYLS